MLKVYKILPSELLEGEHYKVMKEVVFYDLNVKGGVSKLIVFYDGTNLTNP